MVVVSKWNWGETAIVYFLENNTILLNFEAFQNFRNKNLSVEITDVKGMHDIYGNKM